MARQYDGADSLTRANPTGIATNASFTAGFWFYRDSMTGGQGVFCIGDPDVDTARGFSVFSRANGTIEVRFGGGIAVQSATGVISATTWYRVIVRYVAGTPLVALAVDGTGVASSAGDTIGNITTGDEIAYGTPCTAIADSGLVGRLAGAFYLQGVELSAATGDAYLQDLCSLIDDYGPSGTVTANALKALYLFQSADPGDDISGVGNDLTNAGTVDVADPSGVPSSCALGPSAAVTGTATSAMTEQDVRDGGKTIIITLTGDTWVAAGATFDAQRQAIINGLDAATSPTDGWNNRVRDVMGVSSVVRTSGTVVTITLPATPLYQITATETITVTVPSAALTGAGGDLTGAPTFTVVRGADDLTQPASATNGSGVTTGSLTSDAVGLTRLMATVDGVPLTQIVVLTKRTP